jgi:hypothetical protein
MRTISCKICDKEENFRIVIYRISEKYVINNRLPTDDWLVPMDTDDDLCPECHQAYLTNKEAALEAIIFKMQSEAKNEPKVVTLVPEMEINDEL